MDRIVVYTCITDGRDDLKEDQAKGGAQFVVFLSDPAAISETWEVRPATKLFSDPRRNARFHKLLPHILFDCEYSIWLDGSMQLLVPPEILVEKYLAETDIATFRHPDRECLYAEADTCSVLRLDDSGTIAHQTDRYRSEGYPVNNGLAETKVVLRRHTKCSETFDKEWLGEVVAGSKRDQISFPYVAWKTNVAVMYIPPLRHPEYRSLEFLYTKHPSREV